MAGRGKPGLTLISWEPTAHPSSIHSLPRPAGQAPGDLWGCEMRLGCTSPPSRRQSHYQRLLSPDGNRPLGKFLGFWL